jgi:hypothetical protein
MCDLKAGGHRKRIEMMAKLDMAHRESHDWNVAMDSVAAELVAETGCEAACAKDFLAGLLPQVKQQVFVEARLSLGG